MSNPFSVAQKYLEQSDQTPAPATDLSDGRIIAVLIDSTVLGAPLWFAFDPAFNPGDGIPVFYCDELGLLKDKPASTLRKIYETKKAFGPGTRVRQ